MIRGIGTAGELVIGLTRAEIKGLLEGKRVCVVALPDAPGPHVCIYFGETDADAVKALREAYDGQLPQVRDYRTRPARGDS